LNNAIFAKTGLISYSGPHYSSFGQKLYFDYTLDYFEKCLLSDSPFTIKPSDKWSDDEWYKDQDKRDLINNEGYWVFNEGKASGTILGANLCTFNLLQGTEFMPELKDSVLFLEDDYESQTHHIDRNLQSLIHQPGFDGVNGLVLGRFQKGSGMTKDLLYKIVKSKKELDNIPIVANVDFGHTDPKITFPIGGQVSLEISRKECKINIAKH
jgi:muramoyltetrapeptide carboxypeptidase